MASDGQEQGTKGTRRQGAPSGTTGRLGASAGSPLPDRARALLETQLGTDLSDVRVLNNSCLPKMIGARAFATGSDLHFAPGQYQPDTTEGRRLLAHELAHVAQQRGGTR